MKNDSHDTGRNMNMWSDPSKNIIQLALITFLLFLNVFSCVQIRCPVFKNLFITYLERSLKI